MNLEELYEKKKAKKHKGHSKGAMVKHGPTGKIGTIMGPMVGMYYPIALVGGGQANWHHEDCTPHTPPPSSPPAAPAPAPAAPAAPAAPSA